MSISYLTAGGARLEYAWYGPPPDQATTLVFLHEGLGCVSMWRDFPAEVAAATGCGVLVYSRRGYGRSDACDLPRPVRFMHDEALQVLPEVLAALNIGDHILVGHSDGASISLISAGSGGAPGLKGVIVEAPHVFVEDISVSSIATIKQIYETTDFPDKLARHHGDNTECAFRGWNDVWLENTFVDWNIEEYLPGIAVPLLVIQGEDDEYGTPDQVRAVEAQAGGAPTGGPVEVHLLPDCGHSPHRDQAAKTLDLMKGFVATHA